MRRAVAVLLCLIAAVVVGAIFADSAVALVSTGDGTWFWRSPQPQGNLLNAVCTVGDSLWAVGEGGTILHSTDGGGTWSAQPSGTSLALNDVTFADAENGWAVGGDDGSDWGQTSHVVLHTTDGGETWLRQHAPGNSDADLWAATCTDARTAWAVGDYAVYATTDGGQTWSSQRIGAMGGMSSIVFPTAKEGLMGGAHDGTEGAILGAVLRTTDAGRHWHLVRLGSWAAHYQLVDPVFADAAHGWAILAPGDWEVGSGGYYVVATSNGGVSWRLVPVPPHISVSSLAIEPNGSLCVAARDTVGHTAVFLESSDGGRHWSRRYVHLPVPADMATDGAGLCGVGRAILTCDSAGTWRPSTNRALVPYRLQMFDDAHGVGLLDESWDRSSDKTAFVQTTDGLSWNVISELPLWSVEGLAFVDSRHGWVIGSGGSPNDVGTGRIYATSDGGLTWQKQTDLPATQLTSLSFADAQHGWVCGTEFVGRQPADVLLATTDGGQTWQREHLPHGFSASALDFISPLEGWAVGFSSHVCAHTTDGGAHWTLSKTVFQGYWTPSMDTVSFVDSQHGWATGEAYTPLAMPFSYLMATTDGGRTWTRQRSSDSFQNYSGVAFTDAMHGWLFAGDDSGNRAGNVWQTSDGGAHWAAEDSGIGAGIFSACMTAGQVYGVGTYGFVSTVDRSGQVSSPYTYDDFDGHYHRSDVVIHLTAADVGGGTVSATQYRVDGDPNWQTYSGAITIPAPADHSNDGRHRLYYRSIDSNGNVEPSGWWLTVPIDTLGPVTQAGSPLIVARGRVAHLAYRVDEKTSPAVRVVINLRSTRGRSVATFLRASSPVNLLEHLSFRCNLLAGRYRYTVYATDMAGNSQTKAGYGWLIVKAAPGRSASSS